MMPNFLSDRLKATRDCFKRHVHGGKTFSSDEIVSLVEDLDELVAMAGYQENKLRLYGMQDVDVHWATDTRRNCRCTLVPVRVEGFAPADNVVSFPGVTRNQPRHPDGGGSAA